MLRKWERVQEMKMKIAKNRFFCKKNLVFFTEILYNVKGQKRHRKRTDIVGPLLAALRIKEIYSRR